MAALFAILLALPAAPQLAFADWDAETAAVLIIINNYRQQNGLVPLVVDSRLQQAADAHARNQVFEANCLDANPQTCSHTDTMGRDPSARAQAAGYPNVVAENMMFPATTAKWAFDGWKESPPHNANMLQADWRAIGIGKSCKGDQCYWSTKYGVDISEAFAAPTLPVPQASWTGTWNMGNRVLTLTQNGDKVTGTFQLPVPSGMAFEPNNTGKLEGTILPGTAKLLGTWTQPAAGFSIEPPTAGELEFTMAQSGQTIQARMTYPSPDREGWTRTHAQDATRGVAIAAAPPAPAATGAGIAWTAQPGLGTDISIGADGTIMMVGTDQALWRWVGTDWQKVGGPAGIRRVAVASNGDPWVVTMGNTVSQGTLATGEWQTRPGVAADIGTGPDGSVYITESGGFQNVSRWTGADFQQVSFGAFRVTGAADGTVWWVSAEGRISSRSPDDNFTTRRAGTAKDIATGADGSLWIVDSDGAPWKWSGEKFEKRAGADLTAIAVAADGSLWATNNRQQILRGTVATAETAPQGTGAVARLATGAQDR